MRYLCLIYEDEKWWEKASKDDMQKGMAEYTAFTESIKKSGAYVGGEALQPTTTAASVRVRNGKISTTDGPYVETKEQLGGYYLIKAKDLNDAVQVAARIPGARHGTVEVRPIMEFDQP
ncbi:MAG TPA: YciI family protein [Gemmatimonadales bacterium]|nr:YciI family protein [Gemmatimonadales bacterium]